MTKGIPHVNEKERNYFISSLIFLKSQYIIDIDKENWVINSLSSKQPWQI